MQSTPPDPRSPGELWDEQHRLIADEPLIWMLKAESLSHAFEILIAYDERKANENAQDGSVHSVAYMLSGFAIENLLKGQLVASGKHRNDTGALKLKTHNLRQLAVDAGHTLNEGENRLLERIEEFTVWTARYPVPIKPIDMRPRPTPDGGFAPRTYHRLGEDWPAIRGLLIRFKEARFENGGADAQPQTILAASPTNLTRDRSESVKE